MTKDIDLKYEKFNVTCRICLVECVGGLSLQNDGLIGILSDFSSLKVTKVIFRILLRICGYVFFYF